MKSARRALELFEFFAERQTRATVNDVRYALAIPQSSASMLLHMLTDLGYLSYDNETRSFLPTVRVASFGGWLLDRDGDTTSPLSVMKRLGTLTGDTIVLGLQRGVHAIYVQVLQATNPVRFYMRAGARRPLCTTAVGLALLSGHSAARVTGIVRRVNAERLGDEAPLDLKLVMDAIEQGRAQGHFESAGMATPGAGVMAAPLPSIADHPPLAIGIGAPLGRLSDRRHDYARFLREAIGSMSSRDIAQITTGLAC